MSRAIKTSRRRSSRVFTISFPEPLAKQVIAVAKDENRNISELFREAFRGYAVERRHRELEAARAEAARRGPIRYTENDVESLVDEIRARGYERRKKTA
jgi:metal-responsive CopG/Arc/MetJ family transcriptional regulator